MLRLVLLPTVSFALLMLSGCEPECVDKYDCRKKGSNLICNDKGRCVPDPDTPFPHQQPDFGGPGGSGPIEGDDFDRWDGAVPSFDGGHDLRDS